MKLGTFVGKKPVEFTEEEKTAIKTLVETIKNSIGICADSSIRILGPGNSITFYIELKNSKKNYRTRLKDVINPKYITCHFYAEEGYDQNVTGPCYTWPKDFEPELNLRSLTMSVAFMGNTRAYRCKRPAVYTSLGSRACLQDYQYGTEVADLDISTFIDKCNWMFKGMKETDIDISSAL